MQSSTAVSETRWSKCSSMDQVCHVSCDMYDSFAQSVHSMMKVKPSGAWSAGSHSHWLCCTQVQGSRPLQSTHASCCHTCGHHKTGLSLLCSCKQQRYNIDIDIHTHTQSCLSLLPLFSYIYMYTNDFILKNKRKSFTHMITKVVKGHNWCRSNMEKIEAWHFLRSPL